jgi:predicted aldo/keto reductase-like oxidoreductase
METFMEDFETSLERLQMDFVEILYVHSIKSRNAVLHKPLLKTLEKIKKSGKARFIGVSTHTNMADVILAATEADIYDVVLTTYNFQMAQDIGYKEALQKVADAGLGIVGMKTMAGGFLDRERQVPVNAKAALKWALQNENIHTTIPGYTSFDQLEESFSAMEDLSLTDDEMKDLSLNDLSATLFCEGCNQCANQCKKGYAVPDLMRAYMYTYGYHEYEKAQDLLATMDELGETPCDACDQCSVTCKKGFNISERISDVARLKTVPREFFT